MNSKVKNQQQIVLIARSLRKQGKKIVTYNGSFDILHPGHIYSLKEAKGQGGVLIIALNSDKSVRLYKGPNHPINSQVKRAKALAALPEVDYIVFFDEINCKSILSKIKPNVHCNGADWGKNCIERTIVEENGGRVHVLKWKPGFSTSRLVEKMPKCKEDVKAVFLDRDGPINKDDPNYVYKIEKFKFSPGALAGIKNLAASKYKIIIITNQSGIGKKIFTHKDLGILHKWMIGEIKKSGGRIDAIYYCPHHPDDNCDCRKPKIGMFLKAAKDFKINLSKSWFVGDNEKDIMAGREANIKTIKIGKKMAKNTRLEPNSYARDLLSASKTILKNA